MFRAELIAIEGTKHFRTFRKTRHKTKCTYYLIYSGQKKQVNSYTLPTAEILSGKNGWERVSMVLYLKKYMKIKILKPKKNPGSPLKVTC